MNGIRTLSEHLTQQLNRYDKPRHVDQPSSRKQLTKSSRASPLKNGTVDRRLMNEFDHVFGCLIPSP